MVKISAGKCGSKPVDFRVDGFLEMNEVEIFGEPVVDQTPEPGFESGIFGQHEPAVGRVDDLVCVHACAREVADRSQQPESLLRIINDVETRSYNRTFNISLSYSMIDIY